MNTPALYRRILRRETHSSRSTIAISLSVVLVVVFAWIGTESVLALLSQPALLVAPRDALAAITGLPTDVPPAAIIAVGSVIAVVGLVIAVFALAPGRRARHTGEITRTAAVVDNAVIASALARTASYTANVDPAQVIVTVGHRTAEVFVQPSSGFSIDRAEITEAVKRQIDEFALTPALRAKVIVERKGVVGA